MRASVQNRKWSHRPPWILAIRDRRGAHVVVNRFGWIGVLQVAVFIGDFVARNWLLTARMLRLCVCN